MNENNTDNSLSIKKNNQISTSNISPKEKSSNSLQSNNLIQRKVSFKDGNNLNKNNESIKKSFNLTSQKSNPLKAFYSDNIVNKLNSNNSQRKLTRTITSYNNTNLKTNINVRFSNLNNNNFIKKVSTPLIFDDKNISIKDINASKSSEKSSSIFLTSRHNYSHHYTNISRTKFNNRNNFKNYKINKAWEIIDPLHIPEEDKIFDELKKIDSLTERYNRKYKFNNEENDDMENFEKINTYNVKNTQSDKKIKNKDENINKNALNNFSKTFYNRKHFKLSLESKDLLDSLYMTSGDYFKKLNKIKRNKNKKKLTDYQNDLLDFVQPTISKNGYNRLKDKFNEISKKNKVYKNWDFKFLNKIENKEESIVNKINYYYKRYLTDENSKDMYYTKYSLKYLELDLPTLEFHRVSKKPKEDDENKLNELFLNFNINNDIFPIQNLDNDNYNKTERNFGTQNHEKNVNISRRNSKLINPKFKLKKMDSKININTENKRNNSNKLIYSIKK